jgi:hypothetical protein
MSEGLKKILRIISFIPLVVYPFILLANVMSLAAYKSGEESIFLLIVSKTFLILSTLYPITLVYSLRSKSKNDDFLALLPIIHIVICLFFMGLWMAIDN